MKYRIIAFIFFLCIMGAYFWLVHPKLESENQSVNLVVIVGLFMIGMILGFVGRKKDTRRK